MNRCWRSAPTRSTPKSQPRPVACSLRSKAGEDDVVEVGGELAVIADAAEAGSASPQAPESEPASEPAPVAEPALLRIQHPPLSPPRRPVTQRRAV